MRGKRLIKPMDNQFRGEYGLPIRTLQRREQSCRQGNNYSTDPLFEAACHARHKFGYRARNEAFDGVL